ncbi:ATP-dependent helicase HrpB [Pelosinus sp. sgz500959]|uniref:ATP-dependent helicase HrpB n=1 Tax=Pelosinus sp. sgz500959 TaxID=3242472 RepID=UPI00366F9CAB
MKRLPIEDILINLQEKLSFHQNAVLVAPPGAGKTTRIPLALLEEPWLAGKRIVMLEPRRLAARFAARYMSALLGEQVGETVGYRIRFDTCVGPKTRIEVITEGILTRMLQSDPMLENVGIIIFDEFHERSIHADLGLALCLQSQGILREDLKILVMSATLDAVPIAKLMGDAPVIVSEGLSFPVETHYLARSIDGPIGLATIHKIKEALTETQGDILVFLPGVREINWVSSRLMDDGIGQHMAIAKLYGALPQTAQDIAILPDPTGKRKIVLATSIAETSITVEGVRVVIDSGFMRVPRFSPRTGMMHLSTVKVSRGSADQRRGRAGRIAPGICYRLWTQQEELTHELQSTPEIMEADLVPLALELAAWGANPDELLWLDPPPQAAFSQGKELLQQLGALSVDGKITDHGRKMAKVGLHPRLSHMILRAISLGYGNLACEIAALLGQRDLFQGDKSRPDADLRLRIEALRQNSSKLTSDYSLGYTIDASLHRRLQGDIRHWKQLFAVPRGQVDDQDVCGLLLAFAYPDRIGQGRGDGRFLLRNGRGAAFKEPQALAKEPYLVAAELGGEGSSENRIFLAAPISESDLKKHFKDQIVVKESIAWDHDAQAVRGRRSEVLGSLVLTNNPLSNLDTEQVLSALIAGIRQEGISILPWSKKASQFRQRLDFMYDSQSEWPDVSDEGLLERLEEWLGPYLYGMTSRSQLERLQMVTILESMLTWQQRQHLDEWAPTHITVPSGQRIPIDYSHQGNPILAVRLQEMFGLKETPLIGQGRVPLTLHLLSPAQRPMQVTKDLASFWENTYFEVKKDLMGRYPKHYWPDNPLEAMPTHRVRPLAKS